MDAIEYSVKLASQIAANGSIKEAYDQYLTNLGKLVVRLKTNVEMSDTGFLKDGEEALFRMIPLCRTCVTKIEDILEAGAKMARSATQIPPPLAKTGARSSSFFTTGDMASPMSAAPELSLFSAVLDSFPNEFTIKPVVQSSSSGIRMSEALNAYEIQDSENEELSPRESLEGSMKDIAEGDRSQLSIITNPDTRPTVDRGMSISQTTTTTDTKPDASATGKSQKTTAPEVPSSPLSSNYMMLSQKLVNIINSPTMSPETSQISENCPSLMTTLNTSEAEEANAIRTKIAKILHMIQMASVTNPAVNLLCFRPIAVAYQLCVIDHSLLRQIHSNDILIHKPPHSPAPSLQGTSDFFNYLTRLVECSILQQVDISVRVKLMLKWFKVAGYLKRFNNFQSLKAITSAINTPPINRLKKTWVQLKKKNSNELLEFEDLCMLVSEQNNYSAYRNHIKNHQTRPMVPFFGVILHDVTYISVAVKKEGNHDVAMDKRIQEIQKFIRHWCAGPRYSYDMLIDMDFNQSSFTGTAGLQKKGFKKRLKGGGLSEQGIEILGSLFKDNNEEEIGTFISHWLLTRKWVTEKEVDDLSLLREPKLTPTKNPTLSANDSAPDVDRRPSKSSEDEAVPPAPPPAGKPNEPTATASSLKPKEIMAFPASPSLSRARAIGGSTSFIEAIKETAYTLVSKQSKPAIPPTSGACTPGTNAAKSAKLGGAKGDQPRNRQLENLLRRRQKSLGTLDIEGLGSSTKSLSMDTGINSSRPVSAVQNPEKGASFDSVSGSVSASVMLGIEKDETESAYSGGYSGVASDELKKKLEMLVNTANALEPRTRRRSSTAAPLGRASLTASAIPAALVKEAAAPNAPPAVPSPNTNSNSHRHGFFTSFFSHTDDSSTSAAPDSHCNGRMSESRTLGLKLSSDIHKHDTTAKSLGSDQHTPIEATKSIFSFTKQHQASDADHGVFVSEIRSSENIKPVKSRRRASSQGISVPIKPPALDPHHQYHSSHNASELQNWEVTSDTGMGGPARATAAAAPFRRLTEEEIQPHRSSDQQPEEPRVSECSDRHSVGTIKPTSSSETHAETSAFKPSLKNSKPASVDQKSPEHAKPSTISAIASSGGGVLSWGSKFSKASGTKTPTTTTFVASPSSASLHPIATTSLDITTPDIKTDKSPTLKHSPKSNLGKLSFSAHHLPADTPSSKTSTITVSAASSVTIPSGVAGDLLHHHSNHPPLPALPKSPNQIAPTAPIPMSLLTKSGGTGAAPGTPPPIPPKPSKLSKSKLNLEGGVSGGGAGDSPSITESTDSVAQVSAISLYAASPKSQ